MFVLILIPLCMSVIILIPLFMCSRAAKAGRTSLLDGPFQDFIIGAVHRTRGLFDDLFIAYLLNKSNLGPSYVILF